MAARVKRGGGPNSTMTKNTYRRKALAYLKEDFSNRCAYCLQPLEEQHINQNHVEHFNAHLPERQKNAYKNLMLACSACNLAKSYKKVADPLAPERRLLNCTLEKEFPAHIVEDPKTCKWEAKTEAGDYHLRSIDLNEQSHVRRRARRREIADRVKALRATSIQYSGEIHVNALTELNITLKTLSDQIKNCVPFPTDQGLQPPPSLYF
jgi:hypothetical protein